MLTNEELQQAIQKVEAAASEFATGDATAFKQCFSKANDTTIFGGLGAYEMGWEEIGPRLEWAAGRFAEGWVSYEPLAMGESGDLGYATGIERGEARVIEGGDSAPIVLRVTHIFRREEGEWKIIHRHADPLHEKTKSSEILDRKETRVGSRSLRSLRESGVGKGTG